MVLKRSLFYFGDRQISLIRCCHHLKMTKLRALIASYQFFLEGLKKWRNGLYRLSLFFIIYYCYWCTYCTLSFLPSISVLWAGFLTSVPKSHLKINKFCFSFIHRTSESWAVTILHYNNASINCTEYDRLLLLKVLTLLGFFEIHQGQLGAAHSYSQVL